MHHTTTMITRLMGVASLTLLLAACTAPHSSAYDQKTPLSLLDVSSEVVTLGVANKQDVADLTRWIATDAPTRAELQCEASSMSCNDALRTLQKKKVAVTTVPSASNTVTLVYERIIAHDCVQKYRTWRSSPYNEPATSHGCSVNANIVQHVSDKSVFINPPLADKPTARSAVTAVQRANAPDSQPRPRYSAETSLTKASQN